MIVQRRSSGPNALRISAKAQRLGLISSPLEPGSRARAGESLQTDPAIANPAAQGPPPAVLEDCIDRLPWLLLTRPEAVVALAVTYANAMPQEKRNAQAAASQRKRFCDLAIAAGVLLILFPILVAVTLFLKLFNRGKVFLAHTRVGLRGRPFPCYKFRTMVPDAEEQLCRILASDPLLADQWRSERKLKNDPRITTVGHFLRKTSLDEVPQLINVLCGHMSCVGPRPITAEECTLYGKASGDYASVRPGLTGLWQVCGRSHRSYAERIALDRLYVQAWSFRLDLAILIRTIPTVLRIDQTA
jgi:exopolysaccharide production protein ExoY